MNRNDLPKPIVDIVRRGTVIPAAPLALNARRQFDERRQRALMRYYVDAGVGGVAIGMHFMQFEIRTPGIDLFEPVLRVCSDEIDRWAKKAARPIAKVADISGLTASALKQAETALNLGYHFGIVSMAAFRGAMEQEMIHHMRELAQVMPMFGFYLLTGVGGIKLPYTFWRELVEIENIVGIKIAPFDRYGTIDVARAVADAGAREGYHALYRE
jgi:dihydrodipicolinate synthase/N-acetylneuraminate lyase